MIYECYIDELQNTNQLELTSFFSEWSGSQWFLDDNYFRNLKLRIEESRLSPKQIRKLFYQAMFQWASTFQINHLINGWLARFDQMNFWNEWCKWLEEVRQEVRKLYLNSQYPQEIVMGIYKSLEYMKNQPNLDFTQEDVAEIACMSRGYFSKYFIKVVGSNFTDFVKQLRINKAKEILTFTSHPIYEIAEKTGFKDERYFSRVFSNTVGCLPSEYRNKVRNEKKYENCIK